MPLTVAVVNGEGGGGGGDKVGRKKSKRQSSSYSCFDKGCPIKNVKAYATMPIGIMGSKSLALID